MSVFQTDGRPRKYHKRRATDRDTMSPESLQAAESRTRRVIRQKIMTIQADRLFTLTYRENQTDIKTAWHHWRLWLKRLRRAGIEFQYVTVAERQERGAIHFHFATNTYLNVNVLRHHWRGVTGDIWLHHSDVQSEKAILERQGELVRVHNGNVDVTSPRKGANWKPHKLAVYLGKYITKEMITEFGRRRFRASEGIELKKNVQYFGRGLPQIQLERYFREQTRLEPRTSIQLEYSCYWMCSWDTRPPRPKDEPPDGDDCS